MVTSCIDRRVRMWCMPKWHESPYVVNSHLYPEQQILTSRRASYENYNTVVRLCTGEYALKKLDNKSESLLVIYRRQGAGRGGRLAYGTCLVENYTTHTGKQRSRGARRGLAYLVFKDERISGYVAPQEVEGDQHHSSQPQRRRRHFGCLPARTAFQTLNMEVLIPFASS